MKVIQWSRVQGPYPKTIQFLASYLALVGIDVSSSFHWIRLGMGYILLNTMTARDQARKDERWNELFYFALIFERWPEPALLNRKSLSTDETFLTDSLDHKDEDWTRNCIWILNGHLHGYLSLVLIFQTLTVSASLGMVCSLWISKDRIPRQRIPDTPVDRQQRSNTAQSPAQRKRL